MIQHAAFMPTLVNLHLPTDQIRGRTKNNGPSPPLSGKSILELNGCVVREGHRNEALLAQFESRAARQRRRFDALA